MGKLSMSAIRVRFISSSPEGSVQGNYLRASLRKKIAYASYRWLDPT
jgi:hypothetical protein